MSLIIGLVLSVVVVLLLLVLLSKAANDVSQTVAKRNGQNPNKHGVLPSNLSNLLGLSTDKPNAVPEQNNFISLKKGFQINLLGAAELEPNQEIETVRSSTYAIKPKDFIGMMPIPKVVVAEGDNVKAGDILFYDKQRPEIKYAAPVSGVYKGVNRGEKRSINEVVIALEGKEISYRNYEIPNLEGISYEVLTTFLLESGVWPFIRQRPYDIVADYKTAPKSIFVTTFDTAPLAPSFELTVQGREQEFQKGLDVLTKLTEGNVHLGINANDANTSTAFTEAKGVEKNWIKGVHPAGNVGVHIHHIHPINSGEVVWHLDVHAVLVIGTLFEKGIFDTKRVVALTGAELDNPRYVYAHQGLAIADFVADVTIEEEVTTTDKEGKAVKGIRKAVRLVSGDPLTGKEITANGYLGFFDDQLTTIAEGDYYELFGWLIPQKGRPTNKKSFPAGHADGVFYNADTQQNGEHRAWVVSGEYEAVLPMDIYPQHLLRAIKANDFEKMEGLGILELGEEDLALCEYVCTSKQPVQKMLREGLDMLREQG